MIRYYKLKVTAAGSAGAATGSAQTPGAVCGEVLAVHLDYSASAAATTDVVFSQIAPANTILTVSNNATDGWYYPRIVVQDNVGADVTYDGTNEIYAPAPVCDALKIAVDDANAADTVTATIIVRE